MYLIATCRFNKLIVLTYKYTYYIYVKYMQFVWHVFFICVLGFLLIGVRTWDSVCAKLHKKMIWMAEAEMTGSSSLFKQRYTLPIDLYWACANRNDPPV